MDPQGPWRGKTRKWQNRGDINAREALSVLTDASNVGLGAIVGNEWFYWPNASSMGTEGSTVKEVYAIFLALQRVPADSKIILHTDNSGVVAALRSGSTSSVPVHKLLVKVVELILDKNILLHCKFIAGRHNILADNASRGRSVDKDDWAFCDLDFLCAFLGWNVDSFSTECYASLGGINCVCPNA